MTRCLLAALFALSLVALAPAQKRAFTIADLYRLKSVDGPRISPDGKRVAFTVTEYDLARGKSNADVWVAEGPGEAPRRIARGPKSESSPRWSPDGRELLFVSTRSGKPQLYRLDLRGGEARALTSLATGATHPEWSRDGRHVVFHSSVFPEYGADDAGNKRDLEAMKKGPVQAHVADRLFYRHWDSWRDGRRRHLFAVNTETGKVHDLTPGDTDVPPLYFVGNRGFAISPDGSEVCYTANTDPQPWTSTNGDLFVVPITGGKPRNITAENRAHDGEPRYSPNGRYIAFLRQTVPGYEADRFRLAVLNRMTGQLCVVTESFDYWVREFAWAPDSSGLYFTADHQGHVPLFRVGVAGGEVEKVADLKTIDEFCVAPDGGHAVVTRRSVGEPVELFGVSLAAGDKRPAPRRLTTFNKRVEDTVDIRPAESVWIEGADGKKVHVFLVKPHGFDPKKKYPLILNVRGGPQGMWADAFRGDWQVYPGAGYVVAFPNPTGSTGYGQKYTEAISRDWGGKVFDDLMKVTDALAKLPYVDGKRMGAMGWSWGGYMMMWFEGHTDRFKALASMMGVYDLASMYRTTEELWFPHWDFGGPPWGGSPDYQRFNPARFTKNFKTPCLVIAGERDYRVSYTQSLQFFTDLQQMKVPSRLIVFKNDGHWPSWVKSMPLYYNAHLDWFHRYLGGAPAPWDTVQMARNRVFEQQQQQQEKKKKKKPTR